MKHARSTHRSRSGKKLYALRDAKGRFTDIQSYKRAHRKDLEKKHTGGDRRNTKRVCSHHE